MNIFLIGSRYVNSITMRLPSMLGRLGCNIVGYIDTFAFAQKYQNEHPEINVNDCFKGNSQLPVSFYKEVNNEKIKYDAIVIEQNGYSFKNDVDIPVIYYHRDTPTPLFMFDMDVLLYRFKSMEKQIPKDHPKIWGNGIMKAQWLNGVDVYEFLHDQKKIYKGINWIGWGRPFEFYWNKPDQVEYYKFARYICEESEKRKLVTRHKAPIPYLKYKNILQKSEAVLIVPGNGSYVTRKIYEAAVSKTLIVLWVQNQEAMKMFEKIGLKANENCIMFSTIEQLAQIKKKWNDTPKKRQKIVNNAFIWVSTHHTWLNRARELIHVINTYNKERNREN